MHQSSCQQALNTPRKQKVTVKYFRMNIHLWQTFLIKKKKKLPVVYTKPPSSHQPREKDSTLSLLLPLLKRISQLQASISQKWIIFIEKQWALGRKVNICSSSTNASQHFPKPCTMPTVCL